MYQSVPGSNGNEGELHIPLISRTGASLSDDLESYPGHLLWMSYPNAMMQSVYYTDPLPADFCLLILLLFQC